MLSDNGIVSQTILSNDQTSRDKLVAAATAGQTSFSGVTYQSTEQDISGLIAAGSNGVNHGKTYKVSRITFVCSALNFTDIAIDGIVKMLTVTIV